MKVYRLEPSGFCDGVNRALALARANLHKTDSPLYLLGSLVHNEDVIAELRKEGFIPLDERDKGLEEYLKELPTGSRFLWSAHGHPAAMEELAKERNLISVDATCPFVKANEARIRLDAEEHEVIYLGVKGHLECQSALSLSPRVHLYPLGADDPLRNLPSLSDGEPVLFSQTTVSLVDIEKAVSSLRKIYPRLIVKAAPCPASKARQAAVSGPLPPVGALIVLGSKSSNNSRELSLLAQKAHPDLPVFFVRSSRELPKAAKLREYGAVALIGGASTSPASLEVISSYLVTI